MDHYPYLSIFQSTVFPDLQLLIHDDSEAQNECKLFGRTSPVPTTTTSFGPLFTDLGVSVGVSHTSIYNGGSRYLLGPPTFVLLTLVASKAVENDRRYFLFISSYRGPYSEHSGPSYNLWRVCTSLITYDFTVILRFRLQLTNHLEFLHSDFRFGFSCEFYVGKVPHMSLSMHWGPSYRFSSKVPVFYEVITLGWTFGPFRAYFPCTQSVSNLLLFWC